MFLIKKLFTYIEGDRCRLTYISKILELFQEVHLHYIYPNCCAKLRYTKFYVLYPMDHRRMMTGLMLFDNHPR